MFKANIIYKFIIMKKRFLNLGTALNKAEQKVIFGGNMPQCAAEEERCYFPATRSWYCVSPDNCPN